MKHPYISLILGSTLAVSALVAPLATFAKGPGNSENNQGNNGNHYAYGHVKHFNFWTNWFNNHFSHRNVNATTTPRINNDNDNDGDNDGNNGNTGSPVIATTTPLILSNINENIGSTTVGFSWNTNKLADSEILYSTTSPVVGGTLTQKLVNASQVTTHSLSVTGLATSTKYYFVLQSIDALNNPVTTSEIQATTTAL
jgi:hypothetical protein